MCGCWIWRDEEAGGENCRSGCGRRCPVNGWEVREQDEWGLARDQRVEDAICDCVNRCLLESNNRSCVEDMQQSVAYQKGEVSGREEGWRVDEEGVFSAGEKAECEPGDGTELEVELEDDGEGTGRREVW